MLSRTWLAAACAALPAIFPLPDRRRLLAQVLLALAGGQSSSWTSRVAGTVRTQLGRCLARILASQKAKHAGPRMSEYVRARAQGRDRSREFLRPMSVPVQVELREDLTGRFRRHLLIGFVEPIRGVLGGSRRSPWAPCSSQPRSYSFHRLRHRAILSASQRIRIAGSGKSAARTFSQVRPAGPRWVVWPLPMTAVVWTSSRFDAPAGRASVCATQQVAWCRRVAL
jgi:hypothetical protein